MKNSYFNLIKCLITAIFCLYGTGASAKVKLPMLVSDGMVLQREQPVKIWGTADPGEIVQVSFQKQNATLGSTAVSLPHALKGRLPETYQTKADDKGYWCISLLPMKPGGPYCLRVNDQTIHQVLIGDVLLCTGQSNMQLEVARVMDRFKEEVQAYNNPYIHHITIPNTYNFHEPQTDIPTTAWKPLTQENVVHFSATAYFTAKELYSRTGVPVGLINSCWGGTPVEAWISEEGIKPFPAYLNDKQIYEDDAYCSRLKANEAMQFKAWNETMDRNDPGLPEQEDWTNANFDDSDWQEVDLFSTSWGNNGLNFITGSHWFRKSISVPEDWQGKAAVLRMGCIVDADSVYINGVRVGFTTYQYPPRIYPIPSGLLKPGKNTIAVRLISNWGQPHFVLEKPYKLICEGNITQSEIDLQGYWKYHLGAPMPVAPSQVFLHYKPVCLYNSMIAPLANIKAKGVIWYQGESNVERRNEYESLLTALIKDWRRTLNDSSLPFYIVELADYLSRDDIAGRKAWEEMREAQAATARHNAHAILIKNKDLGEWNDIHPLDKKTLGKRIVDAILNPSNNK